MSNLKPFILPRSVSPLSPSGQHITSSYINSDQRLRATFNNLSSDGLDDVYHSATTYPPIGYQDNASRPHIQPSPQQRSDRRPSRAAALGAHAASLTAHAAAQLRRGIRAAPTSDILSLKASFRPGFYLCLGLIGRAGYGIGPALIEHQLVDIAPPPGATPGPGAGGNWQGLPLGWSALVTSLGATLGIVSALCFLTDALKIPGNRGRAFFYFSMHCLAICLISASRAIIDVTKTRLPRQHLLIAVLPAAFGLGVHWVTIPRSFATSEVVHGNFIPIQRLEQRQLLAEVVQFSAAIFIALWSASNGLSHIHPLEREAFLVAGSIAVILGFALPNTNWRRAHQQQLNRQRFNAQTSDAHNAMERGEVRFAPVTVPYLESPASEAPLVSNAVDNSYFGIQDQLHLVHNDPDLALKRVTTN